MNFDDFDKKLEGNLAGYYDKIREDDTNTDYIYPFRIEEDLNFFEAFMS